ncbi:M56 family metallopeptidase [Hymenobacter tenuis]
MMPDLLVYLLKANGALLLLVGVYYAFLRRLTFHQLNRAYLLGAVVFAALYPLLDVSGLLTRPAVLESQLTVLLPTWASGTSASAAAPVAAGPDYGAWLLGLYGAGTALMLLRLVVQGASLAGMHRASRPAQAAGVDFRQVAAPINPFCFWQTIYLNPEQHATTELPAILLHEQVHVRQWHTLDVLVGHAQRIVSWFNPGAWLLLRAVQENLEFITDAAVLMSGSLEPKEYQYSLVRLSTLAPGPALVTPFSFITLKNRIHMMNSQPSSRKQALRYLAVLPLALGLLSLSTPDAASAVLAPTDNVPTATADTEKEAPISALPPAALAYIVKEYPGYRLIGVTEVRAADGSNLRYRAEIASGRRPKKVLFDAKGEPVAVAEPLYFLDGKPVTKAELDALSPSAIESVSVLKREEALKSFGAKANEGAILIITKKNRDSAEVLAFIKEHNLSFAPAKPEDQRLTSSVMAGNGFTAADLGGRLLIINGKEAAPEQAKIAAGQVASVYVLDAPSATKKYGDKGKNGAIVITTK